MKNEIHQIRHPFYTANAANWCKWRSVYKGGDDFIEDYLIKFSKRETNRDFNERKQNTPKPTFAKAAINDIKNSIYQRMADIRREGGSQTYQNAVSGINYGVDKYGSTMNSFIGQDILDELLTMSKVGVYVDMPQLGPNASLYDTLGKQPYLYKYSVEDILTWSYCNIDQPDEFQALLLRDHCDTFDDDTGLICGTCDRYRYIWINRETGYVNVQFYNGEGKPISRDGTPGLYVEELTLTSIPFVVFDIKQSLLEDVDNHQIALLNLGSSDVAYALKANFPFYTEQADLRPGSTHLKTGSSADNTATVGGQFAANQEIEVGTIQGRQYAMEAERPGFIHPSAEPLLASIKLQEKLKEDIRLLVNLAVTNINPKMASAESKTIDQQGLESGLSYIGLVLEHGERQIARYWSYYENSEPAIISYPSKYSLKTDGERRAEAKEHADLLSKIPSHKFQKRILMDTVEILLGGKISNDELREIQREIQAADYITSDSKTLIADLDAGLVSPELASLARGYPKGEAKKAQKARVKRAAEIVAAQTKDNLFQARGVPELSPDPNESRKEKEGKPTRGEGKDTDE